MARFKPDRKGINVKYYLTYRLLLFTYLYENIKKEMNNFNLQFKNTHKNLQVYDLKYAKDNNLSWPLIALVEHE